MADDTMRLELDLDELTVGALLDLEDATTIRALVDWLVKHAGAERDEVRRLPVGELTTIADQIKDALQPPKPSAPR